MCVLITGGTGFLGRRLVKLFESKGIHFQTLGRNRKDSFYCDFGSNKIPENCMDDAETIIHLAGHAHDIGSNRKQESNKHEQINFQFTKELIELAKKKDLKKFIYISSVKAGGKNIVNGCLNEESEGFRDNFYSASKRKAETFLREYENENMKVLILRPSLVYGPNMKGNFKLMQNFINKGLFPPLPNLDSYKALVHVDDVARSILFLLEDKELKKEIFIITDGNLYSPREIYESLSLSLGKVPLKWSLPKNFFKLLLFFPWTRDKLKKLFINEPYSSSKLRALGFTTKFKLKDINEEAF